MGKIIHASDPLQPGYSYELSHAAGKSFDPRFTPDLTPAEMLALGVFGGSYFEGFVSEFPKAWVATATLSTEGAKPSLNYFGVSASQPRAVWQAKGWIHEADPRGWFQWYCRYYLGRRMPEEDERQILRWVKMRRHAAQVRYGCRPRDYQCRPRQRQALLHWAYDSRKM